MDPGSSLYNVYENVREDWKIGSYSPIVLHPFIWFSCPSPDSGCFSSPLPCLSVTLLPPVEPAPPLTSHEFLRSLLTVLSRVIVPHGARWQVLLLHGYSACKVHIQCPGKKKCCSNLCRYTCQPQKTCTQVKECSHPLLWVMLSFCTKTN